MERANNNNNDDEEEADGSGSSSLPKRRRIPTNNDDDDSVNEQEGSSIHDGNDNNNNSNSNNTIEEEKEEREREDQIAAATTTTTTTSASRRDRAARLARLASEQREERRRRELVSPPPAAADDDNDNSPNNEGRRRRRRHRRGERTAYPGDPAYEQFHHTDAVDSPNRDDNDGDDVEDDDADGTFAFDNPEQDEVHDPEEEDEEGEDLLENAMRDYQRIEALDTYGTEGIDDRDYNAMTVEEREAAEAELARRDAEERRRRGTGGGFGRSAGFYGALDEFEMEEDEEARRARRGVFDRRGGGRRYGEEEDEEDVDEGMDDELDEDERYENEEEVNLEAFDVPLREWIAQDRTRREIQRKFRNFLMSFTEDNYDDEDEYDGEGEGTDETGRSRKRKKRKKKTAFYENRIRAMCALNLSAIEISYLHLMQKEPILAIWIADAPRDMLDVLNEAATRHTLRLFPSYGTIRDEIHVRIADLPVLDSLRDLRRSHLDCLVKVNGVVTRRTGVSPQLKLAYYDCPKCRHVLGPYRVEETWAVSSGPGGGGGDKDAAALHTPGSCPKCSREGNFKPNTMKSRYRNYQRVNLQETPGSVPPGRVPRSKEIILTDDLIDMARPGEEVEITGVFSHSYDYSLTQKSGFPVFQTFITANHVRKREDDSSALNLAEHDIAQIMDLARDPKIGQRIVDSIAPSIYGHRHVKMALAMSLFGAVPKNVDDKHRIRGDINVLLLGDPGTAKSQMLKYAEITAPRAVYTTGKGASAVGLTASVRKDPLTREWILEGGALVLADRGVCLIDEFDKMNEQDRTSIHEAMEQQSISVSKAGIVTSLQARCAVIAAANPIGGRYDSSNTLADNVELTDPILQRFDVLCVLQDTVDPVADERLAIFVTASHMRSVPTNEIARGVTPAPSRINENDHENAGDRAKENIIPQDLLRKYIQYARANVRPVLRGNTLDQEKIASLYVALRKESSSSGGVPIAVRHIESIMRMAEAHAKMHLRDYVRDDDVDVSIGMMLESFISAQKFSVRRTLRRNFAKFLSSGEDRAHLLLHILQEMMRNEAMYQTIRQRQKKNAAPGLGTLEVLLDEFESRARDRRIYDVSEFLAGEAFRDAGYVLDERRRVISRNQ